MAAAGALVKNGRSKKRETIKTIRTKKEGPGGWDKNLRQQTQTGRTAGGLGAERESDKTELVEHGHARPLIHPDPNGESVHSGTERPYTRRRVVDVRDAREWLGRRTVVVEVVRSRSPPRVPQGHPMGAPANFSQAPPRRAGPQKLK